LGRGFSGGEQMTCSEFQRVLPYIIETGGNDDEEEHLRTCAICSDLVNDLRYIAEQAKLLVPMEDPDPRVWDGIQKSLEQEGIVKRKHLTRSATLHMGVAGRVISFAAVAALALFGLARYANNSRGTAQADMLPGTQVAAHAFPQSDQQLLLQVTTHAPSLKHSYEINLEAVNRSIEAARQSVRQHPDDVVAREQLTEAYNQKAMLYNMAISHSLE
jgi:hypothetical protein